MPLNMGQGDSTKGARSTRLAKITPENNTAFTTRRRDSWLATIDVKLKWFGQFEDREYEQRFNQATNRHLHLKSSRSAVRFIIFCGVFYVLPFIISAFNDMQTSALSMYITGAELAVALSCFVILRAKLLKNAEHWVAVHLFITSFILSPVRIYFFRYVDNTTYTDTVENIKDQLLAIQYMNNNTSSAPNITELIRSAMESVESADAATIQHLNEVVDTISTTTSSAVLLVLSCGTPLLFPHMSVQRALFQHLLFFVIFHIYTFTMTSGSIGSWIKSTIILGYGFILIGMTLRQREATVRLIWYKHASLREKAGRMKRVMTQLNIHVGQDRSEKRDLSGKPNVKATVLEIVTGHPGIQALMISVGNLEILEEIARGAMGDVYRASYFDTFVAVKRLPQHLMTKSNMFMFRDEILLLQSFRHPNVINLLGVACDDVSFVAGIFEFMPRGSLRSVLQDPQLSLTWEDPKVKFAVDVARGMSYLHDQQVLHRDLKTDNVLVSSTFVCKVADFGTSKRMRDCSYTQIGTPFWRAPEMIRSEPYSYKADVYSFALILLELQTHENPFESMTKVEAMDFPHKVSQDEWRLPIPDNTPQEIKSLIQDCWTEDPDKRPTFLLILRRLSQLQKSFSHDDASVSDSNLERLMLDEMIMSGRYTRMSYEDGEPIIRAGDMGEDCYIVLKGEVEIRRPFRDMKVAMPVHTTRDGMTLIRVIKTGSYFGEMGLLAHTRRMASCLARGSVTCIKFDRSAFLEVFDEEVHGLVASRIVRVLQGTDKNKKDMDDESEIILRKMGSMKNSTAPLSPSARSDEQPSLPRRVTMDFVQEATAEASDDEDDGGGGSEAISKKVSKRLSVGSEGDTR